jgi:hypothetical protein
MAILDLDFKVNTGTIGGTFTVGDADRYFALSLQNINNVLNSSGISQYAKITSVKLSAKVYASNSTWAEARLKIGYGSPDSINNNAVLYSETKIHSYEKEGTVYPTIDLTSAISNNGMSPFTLSTDSGTCVTFRIWSENVGKKTYSISDAYLDVAYEIPSYTITVANGTVNGVIHGTFEAGTSVTLVPATPTGYEFTEWSDGNTDNPRVVVVTGDQSYVARFKKSGPPFAEDTLIDGVLYVGTDTTNIETYLAYEGRTDIVSVIIPDGRTKIGKCVFESCTNIRDITIPTSVTDLGSGSFGNTYIGEIYYSGTKAQWNNLNIGSAFNSLSGITVYCSDGFLEYVYIDTSVSPANAGTVTTYPGGVKCNFGTYYIRGSDLTLTATPKAGYTFKHWLQAGETDTTNPITYSSENFEITAVFESTSDIIIDGVLYVGTETTNIETQNGYLARKDITSVIVPEGRTFIADTCFGTCLNLTSVTLPSGFEKIDYFAFEGCNKLTEINYAGTKEQWKNVSMHFAFDNLTAITVCCSDGEINYVAMEKIVSPNSSGYIKISHYVDSGMGGNEIFVIKNSSITFTAEPASGYQFKHWICNDEIIVASSNPFSYTVTTNDTLEAVFTISKLYAGTSQAKAVYVGNKPAKAIYIGTTKIYEQ